MAEIRELVLTGGPCAGKTTALAILANELPKRGWRVPRASEAATMFTTGGVPDIAAVAADPSRFTRFQLALTAAQGHLRASFRAMAEALGDNTLIVYDRAETDNAAYIGAEAYRDVISRLGMTPNAVRDSYDAVVHLVTAADGAEHAYTTANNEARRENVEEARALDRATLAAWIDHPRLIVVDNRGSFDDKMRRVLSVALRLLGEPMPLEIERKYLLVEAPDLSEIARHTAISTLEIEQRYLPAGPGSERRVRRQEANGTVTYTLTEKVSGDDPLVRHETERLVGFDVWQDAVSAGAPRVSKSRHVFVYDGQRFELDELLEPRRAWLLEVELASAHDEVRLPPFLVIDREVTSDPYWKNAAIARDAR